MFWQILVHTPKWVFAILFALVFLGWQQSRDRTRKPFVLLIVPLLMVFMSYGSLLSSFGAVIALQLFWLVSLAISASALGAFLPVKGARFDQGRIVIPGSWLPLVLMITIFLTKYAVGILNAMAPEQVQIAGFKLAICITYGAFSGMFIGRALAIWRAAQNGLYSEA